MSHSKNLDLQFFGGAPQSHASPTGFTEGGLEKPVTLSPYPFHSEPRVDTKGCHSPAARKYASQPECPKPTPVCPPSSCSPGQEATAPRLPIQAQTRLRSGSDLFGTLSCPISTPLRKDARTSHAQNGSSCCFVAIRSTVKELPGKLRVNFVPEIAKSSTCGETLRGYSSEFSSDGFAEVNTIACAWPGSRRMPFK